MIGFLGGNTVGFRGEEQVSGTYLDMIKDVNGATTSMRTIGGKTYRHRLTPRIYIKSLLLLFSNRN